MRVKFTAVGLSLVIVLGFCLLMLTGCSSEDKEKESNDLQYTYDFAIGYIATHPLDTKSEEMLLVRFQRAGLTRKEAKDTLENLRYKALYTKRSAQEAAQLEKKLTYSSKEIDKLMQGFHWGSTSYETIRNGLLRVKTQLDANVVWARAGDRFLGLDRVSSVTVNSTYVLSAAASRDWQYFAASGRRSKQQGFLQLIYAPSGYTLGSYDAMRSYAYAVSIKGVAISGDNKYMAAAGEHEIILWNTRKGYVERTWRLDYSASALAMSPDGKYVAVGKDGKRREVHVFKRKSGKRYKKLKGYKMTVKAIAISPGNKTLATLDSDRNFILWNLETGKKIRVISGFASGYQFDVGMAMSPDGKYLAAATGSLIVINPLTGKTIRELPSGGSSGALAISGDNRYIAGTGQSESLKVWDFKTGELVRTIGLADTTNPWVSLSPDGNYVAAVSGNRYIQVWALNRIPAAEECYRRAGLEKTGWLRIADYCSKNKDFKSAATYYDKAGEHAKAEEYRNRQ